jgi:hypothetical protein
MKLMAIVILANAALPIIAWGGNPFPQPPLQHLTSYTGTLPGMHVDAGKPNQFEYSIQLDALVYTAVCRESPVWPPCPKDLIIGDPVQIRTGRRHTSRFWIKKHNGREELMLVTAIRPVERR